MSAQVGIRNPETDQIRHRLTALSRTNKKTGTSRIIGESPALQGALALVRKVAPIRGTTVLIQGESGTGKELFARAIHDLGPAPEGPFVSVNCTAIPETLIEGELFGHEKGGFTDARETRKGLIELANGGTLFLDEIGDMSLAAQVKILRVLEDRTVRRIGGTGEIPVAFRLVCATNQRLEEKVRKGNFRQDLYFRLHVFPILLPPLCKRGDDILLLAYFFLNRFAAEIRKEATGIEPSAQAALKQYAFPGNVRELRNWIEQAVIRCDGKRLTLRDFPSLQRADSGTEEEPPTLNLDEIETRAIRRALEKTDGNQSRAAELLGIGYGALRHRMKKHGFEF